jgi:transposase
MKPFSADLIAKIVNAYQKPGSTFRLVAKQMGISKNTVHKYVNLDQEESPNDLNSKPRDNTLSNYKSCLPEIFKEYPNATLAEYCQILAEKTGKLVSVSTMSRAIEEQSLSKSGNRRSKNSGNLL